MLRLGWRLMLIRQKKVGYFRTFATATNQPTSEILGRDSQTFILPDNRTLGFAEYGSSTGYPLMWFHGFPSSRLEGKGLDKLALKHNIRVISPDRPSYGLSTIQPDRKIMHWPADVYALANHLGISRFAVLGGSGGGPYALACAYTLPKDMLSAVGILAGAPPWIAGTKDILLISRILARFSRTWPSGLLALSDIIVKAARHSFDNPRVMELMRRSLEQKAKADEKDIPVEERRMRLIRTLMEGFAQGSEVIVHESRLLTGDWGFTFEDIKYDPIQVWHGTRDINAPISNIRYMVNHLPHAVLKEYDESHFTIHNHMEEILLELMPLESKNYHKNA